VGVHDTKDVTQADLASMMVGRPVLFDKLIRTGEPGEAALRVEKLCVSDHRGLTAVKDLSLEVRAGEILGIAAIEGNGQSELIEAVTGLMPVRSGRVEVLGREVTGLEPGEIRAAGLAHVPEDRLATGLSRDATVAENLLVGKQREPRFNRFRIQQDQKAIRDYAEEVYERYDIRGAGVEALAGEMSGGNMQKVVIAREFSFETPVLIISQPTRGVDVGAIEFIHTCIMEKRNQGAAILLSSADLDEVFRLSDRIITLYEGEITGSFLAGEIAKEEIGLYMTGSKRQGGTQA
jgi:simple sugar transport system ATP-binding protein